MTDWEKQLEACDARTKATALGLSGGYPDEAKYFVSEARYAIAASDGVMFSDEAIEQAAGNAWNMLVTRDGGRAWEDLEDWMRPSWIANVRVIAAALRGEQP